MRATRSIGIVDGSADKEGASAVEGRLKTTGAKDVTGVGADLSRLPIDVKDAEKLMDDHSAGLEPTKNWERNLIAMKRHGQQPPQALSKKRYMAMRRSLRTRLTTDDSVVDPHPTLGRF